MNKILGYITILAFGISLSACDIGSDPEPGGTAVKAVAGEWFTTFAVNGEDVYGLGYQVITTSNTASNTTAEFLITDNAHTWDYMIKTPLDLEAKTFGGSGLRNLAHNITATITEGKIIPESVTAPSGAVTDSIHFKIRFSDDPGTVYTVSGYKRTGFQEDEH